MANFWVQTYFDDLFAMAAKKTFMSANQLSIRRFSHARECAYSKIPRIFVDGVVEARKELISLNARRTMGEMKTFKSSMLQQQRMKSYGSSSNQDFWISKITLNTLSL